MDTYELKPKVIDLISLVKTLHGLSSPELGKLIRDSENAITKLGTARKSSIQIDIEDLSRIPIHLIARLLQSDPDEAFFKYLLSGLSLLYKLYSIAYRHPRLEQMLLDDIFVLQQSIDLVFCIPAVLNIYIKEHQFSLPAIFLHSSIVASSLYLLRECISPDWSELAEFLSIHPKVERYMDAAFAAIRVDVQLLHMMLPLQADAPCFKSNPGAVEMIKHHCQQCEASLQFIQTLCQQKPFQLCLVKHKVLCREGGLLLLVQLVLNINTSTLVEELNYVAAAISRMKSKVLYILLCLCEIESISYLDEVAKSPRSFIFAKTVALEVLELLKTLFSGHHKDKSSCLEKNMSKGFVQLNAMRLTDFLSDDSHFRYYITMHITDMFTTLLLLQHGEFVSNWCASDILLWEEDAILEYDPSVAAEWVLRSLSDITVTLSSESTYAPCNMPQISYAHERTSLLVKVIANLHCFAPNISKDEKDLFLNSLFSHLQKEISKLSDGAAEKASNINKNLCSLLTHAESLISGFLLEEDVQLLRLFVCQLNKLITTAHISTNHAQSEAD